MIGSLLVEQGRKEAGEQAGSVPRRRAGRKRSTAPAAPDIPSIVVSPTAEQPMLLGLDSPLMGQAKNDRSVMVFSFFSLTRDRLTELPVYDDGKVRIEVTATKHG